MAGPFFADGIIVAGMRRLHPGAIGAKPAVDVVILSVERAASTFTPRASIGSDGGLASRVRTTGGKFSNGVIADEPRKAQD
jgi:hypothetical protein